MGKTTTTCQLAGTLGYRGFDVLVADMDPKRPLRPGLATGLRDFSFLRLCGQDTDMRENITNELGKLASKYDLIIVDCAPSVDNASTWASLG